MDDRNKKSAADKKAERSSVIEEQIRQAQRRKEERAFLEELAKRINIAREGKHFSEKEEFGSALAAYRRFLSITAKAVSVEVEDLRPQLFEEKTMRGESLLISSILFDMLKILDKLDQPEAKEERRLYHRLFIRFTVDQPFQQFAAENLRKFLIYRKSVRNKGEFWATYHAIKIKKFCLIASWAFGSADATEVARLRRIRDYRLAGNRYGRSFIRFYYNHGSSLRDLLEKVPGARPAAKRLLQLVSCLASQ